MRHGDAALCTPDGLNGGLASEAVPQVREGVAVPPLSELAMRGAFIMCQLWCRLGYTLALSKCQLLPVQFIRFLGFLLDSRVGAFRLPEDKRASFASLRDGILAEKAVTLKTLQRLQGKCISFTMAVPGARLYISEIRAGISRASHNSRVSECYQSLTAHQHLTGHTVPKQVIMIATSIQVTTV